MTMTPTKQAQSECKHCLGGIYCEAHIVEIEFIEAVDYCYGICSDYEPKETKDNDSRTTENN